MKQRWPTPTLVNHIDYILAQMIPILLKQKRQKKAWNVKLRSDSGLAVGCVARIESEYIILTTNQILETVLIRPCPMFLFCLKCTKESK